MASSVTTTDPPPLGPGHPLYSHITSVTLSPTTTMITIAGQTPSPMTTSSNKEVPRGLRAQMELALERVGVCLETVGAKKTDMTRLMYYLTERAWEEEEALKLVLEVVGKWLEGHRPASCLLLVKALSRPEFLCEFEAQAVVVK